MDPEGPRFTMADRGFPQEICRRIVDYISGHDLVALSVVSLSFQREAERRLYHIIHITNAAQIKRMSRLFLETPRVSKLVRNLYVYPPSSGGRGTDGRDWDWEVLRRALSELSALEVLFVSGAGGHTEILIPLPLESASTSSNSTANASTVARASTPSNNMETEPTPSSPSSPTMLSVTPIHPFRLKELSLRTTWDPDVASFLETQDQLVSFVFTPMMMDSSEWDTNILTTTTISHIRLDLSSVALPRLKTIDVPLNLACALAPGRPIKVIKATFPHFAQFNQSTVLNTHGAHAEDRLYEGLGRLFEAFGKSTGPVEELHIGENVHITERISVRVMELSARHLPSLAFLSKLALPRNDVSAIVDIGPIIYSFRC
ncbi:hypothetical protein SISSUDRAFT_67547 [Sistotremastrum suecicum HHB10207 ss-3]|uniref:F-box domain-containing protein n=1 Tax=Sistotremastrum suecicum HHB10207 ss-3 TaxID=1314776 RepID=A0A166BJH8_9AGAM|nr:hypothetical protein SISSUDRAFT_67547 [Sistotremastrum suecicum HHB10207 ss-3]